MPTTTESIRSKIDAFLTEIESLTRQAALDAVRAALSGNASTPAPRANGRRVARRAATKPAAPKGKRAKRTTEDVAEFGAKILAFVKSNPGCSSEQIQAGLGLSKKDIQLPIIRLREEKRLKTTGQKRGTKYYAGGAAPKATPVKRAAPKAKPVAAKKRKAMSPEQKAALLERLAKARAARAAKKG
ncbi:MAG: hypothetical protein IT459_20310 [Planctomycetes bacterium]|nr:hypothetical protein [Planctomycetota bacterium]